MREIKITDWAGVFTDLDEEDAELNTAMILKNFRCVRGKLLKTQEPGLKLNASLGDVKNLVTYTEPNSPVSGKLYIAVKIDSGSKKVTWYGWTGSAWTPIQNILPKFTGNGTDWYADPVVGNPIIQNSGIIRFLPGATSKPDGSNEAKGVWLGYINRKYFDELYEPDAAFYNYACLVDKPDISFAVTQHPGDKAFSPTESGIPITNLSTDDDTVTIAGDYVGMLTPGKLFEIENNAANDGKYIVEYSALESNQTVIKIDTAHSDLVNATDKQGTVRFVTGKDIRYYKFSYVYDGVQESLLSEPIRIEFDGKRFLRLNFDVVKANHNLRITGLNVYRSDNLRGLYRIIHTIDFLRKSDNFWSNGSGAYPGLGSVYVPELADFNFNGAKYYKLWVRISDIEHASVGSFQASGQSESNTLISSTARTYAGKDLWNVSWYLKESADDNPPWTTVLSGEDGAYAGEQTVTVNESTGEHDSYGGIFRLHGAANASITEAATAGSGNQTKFTTEYSHGLAVGDIVTLEGFAPEAQYNGYFKVIKVDDATHFTVNVQFGADDTGKWCYGREERIADDNYKRAIHLNDRYNGADNNLAWTLMKVEKGLFYVKNGDTVTIYFYDTGLSEGAEHPFPKEVSVKVNAEHSRIIGNILWQGNVVLDPGGKNEIHEDWVTHTPLLQYDVNPVANVFPLPDREGGPVTGVVDLMSNPVILKKMAMFMINTSNSPSDSSKWFVSHSPHNIGNIAKRGYLEVLGSLYTTYRDGFYRINPNNLAEYDKTETEKLKISWKIDNIFNAMTNAQKEAVIASYNQRRGEVLFAFTYTIQSVPYNVVWAYSIVTGNWREVTTDVKFDIMALDENANVMVYSDVANKVYAMDIADKGTYSEEKGYWVGGTKATVRMPFRRIAHRHPVPIYTIFITYISANDLTLNLYVDYQTDAVETYTLKASSTKTTKEITVNRWCKAFAFEITEEDDHYLTTDVEESYLIVAQEGGVNPITEIGEMLIHVD